MGHVAALSVVIATPDTFETIRRTVGRLREQTARDEIELVVVVPSASALAPITGAFDAFASHVVVEVGAVRSIGEANAAGGRRASAPIVALPEDHVLPDPGWAEALIRAHEGAWAAVGVAVRNANPATRISWAD